jgi:hypothetical protein
MISRMNRNVELHAHCLSCALIIMTKNKEKLNLFVLISDLGLTFRRRNYFFLILAHPVYKM